MQFKGRQVWKRSGNSQVEKTFLFPDNALPSYGSTAHEKAQFLGCHTDDSVSLSPVSAPGMSVKDGMRLITATEVVLPPVKWYEKLYIPGLIKARPSPHSNAIHTTKYTILNFLFKNLWEQFHRVANIYFLFIAVLNFVPAVEAVAKEVAFLPLLFVLGVTAIRDIFEDYRRYRSDKQVNRKVCMVYNTNSGSFVSKQWQNIRVGDVVRLLSDDVIPADIVVLQSSDPTGICYIETANIDGETNLKQRQVAPGLFQNGPEGATGKANCLNPAHFTGKIYCEPPHNKIYEFNGYIETMEGGTIGINKNNLLLRGCVLRNTLSVVGVVVYAGHETKSLLNNSGLRPKRSKLERDINIDVIFQVVILIVLCIVGAIVSGVWNSRHLDTNAPFYPFTSESLNLALESFVRFWTFIILFQVIIPISLYVTIEIVKLVQVYLINFDLDMYYAPLDRPFQCRALNISEDLGQIQYIFSDKTGTLTENKMEFRCCSIGGVNYPHNLAGELRGRQSPSQTTFRVKCNTDEVDFPEKPKKTELDPELVANLSDPVVRDFFTVLAICNTVVISTADGRVESAAGSHIDPPVAESSDQVDMQALKYEAESPDEAALVHAARDYGYTLLSRSPHQCSLALPDGTIVKYDVLHMLEFDSNRKCMSIIVREQGRSEVILYSKGADSAIYRNLGNLILSRRASSLIQRDRSCLNTHTNLSASVSAPHTLVALSAEEEAMDSGVSAGDRTGMASIDQTGGDQAEGDQEEGELEVRRSRKRSRDIDYSNDGGIHRAVDISAGHNQATSKKNRKSLMEMALMRDKTQRHLDSYAKLGLRTLCMAKRVLTEEEYHRWSEERHRADTAIKDREELMSHSAYSIERQLELLGATGIEDQLQTNVPEAIASLQEAGIKVWVLTGDKQETAINIGYSSQLITPEMEVLVLNAYSLDDCRDELMKIKQKLMVAGSTMEDSEDSGDSNTLTPLNSLQAKLIRLRKYSMQCAPSFDPLDSAKALVVDGATLVFALDPSLKKLFLEVAERCKAVLCCRSTPLQKAAVVELVKGGWKKMTLAIGDGANDVSMIQKADVGVGIAGREGMQAVMASDFAMGRFHFLVKLLLVHGHWCYDRLARLILYFFYKNITYATLLFWYQFFNGFTGTSPIDSVNLLIFNLVYTSLPIMVMAVADQDLPAQVLLKNRVLYQQGQCSTVYTRFYFWMTVIDAFYQSAVVFFVTYGAYYFNGIGVAEFGFVVNTSMVVVVSFHLAVETLHWTVAHHFFLWGSVLVCFAFNYVYSAIDTRQRGIDTFAVFERASSRAEFWFVILLSIVIALLPRVLVKVLIQELRPTPVMATQAQLKKKRVRNKSSPSQTSNAAF